MTKQKAKPKKISQREVITKVRRPFHRPTREFESKRLREERRPKYRKPAATEEE